jgi:hypothetical protein
VTAEYTQARTMEMGEPTVRASLSRLSTGTGERHDWHVERYQCSTPQNIGSTIVSPCSK